MNNVVELQHYRRKRRQEYVSAYGKRLDSFIQNFFSQNMAVDMAVITELYLQEKSHDNLPSWDYLDLRESIRDALAETVGEKIFAELRHTQWFDSKMITFEEVIDRCLAAFVLHHDSALIS